MPYRFARTCSTSLVILDRGIDLPLFFALILFNVSVNPSFAFLSRMDISFRSAKSLSSFPALGFNMSIWIVLIV